jgi:hypothetical protein
LLLAIYRAHVQWKGIYYFLLLHWNLLLSRLGLERLTPPFRKLIKVDEVEKIVTNFLDCRFKIVETKVIGAALDVDNEKDYETMKVRFRYWRKYQDKLINRLKNSIAPLRLKEKE